MRLCVLVRVHLLFYDTHTRACVWCLSLFVDVLVSSGDIMCGDDAWLAIKSVGTVQGGDEEARVPPDIPVRAGYRETGSGSIMLDLGAIVDGDSGNVM